MSEVLFWIVGGVLIVGLIVVSVVRVRHLNERIRQYRKEEEEQAARNPYANMAALAEMTEKQQDQK
jgi:hypothetical protein